MYHVDTFCLEVALDANNFNLKKVCIKVDFFTKPNQTKHRYYHGTCQVHVKYQGAVSRETNFISWHC